MRRLANTLILLALAIVMPQAMAAERLAWFDEPLTGALALGSRGSGVLGSDAARFDLKFESLSAPVLAADVLSDYSIGRPADEAMRVYGAFGTRAAGTLHGPSGLTKTDVRLSALGLAWQRRVLEAHTFTLSAELGENVYQAQDTSDTRAAISWTTDFASTLRPRLTGSLFVGDEVARDEAYRHLGRRYFGLSVGGELTLFREHTPYLALQVRRSYYDSALSGAGTEGSALLPPRSDDRSLLSAGWRWQVQRNVSLQAEASYSFNESGYDLYNPERSRVFFGTRFDFR